MTFEPQFGTRGLELAMRIRTSLAWIRLSMVISSMASTTSTDLEALTSDELGDCDKDKSSVISKRDNDPGAQLALYVLQLLES